MDNSTKVVAPIGVFFQGLEVSVEDALQELQTVMQYQTDMLYDRAEGLKDRDKKSTEILQAAVKLLDRYVAAIYFIRWQMLPPELQHSTVAELKPT